MNNILRTMLGEKVVVWFGSYSALIKGLWPKYFGLRTLGSARVVAFNFFVSSFEGYSIVTR